MSQAFSFNFEGDDIELSTNEPDVVGAVGLGGGSKEHEIPQMVKPRCHTIEDLVRWRTQYTFPHRSANSVV